MKIQINIEKSKEILKTMINNIGFNRCYDNVFEITGHLVWDEKYKDYKVVYGYADLFNNGVYYRHCIINYKDTYLDVSPEILDKNIIEYDFIKFEELTHDEYLKMIENDNDNLNGREQFNYDISFDFKKSEKELIVYIENFYMKEHITILRDDYYRYILPKFKEWSNILNGKFTK